MEQHFAALHEAPQSLLQMFAFAATALFQLQHRFPDRSQSL